jgi:fatty-acid peroxygenase
MSKIPRAGSLDSTVALVRDPYHFIRKRADQLGSEVFVTRFMLQKTICLTGTEAARLFNDGSHMTRQGAAPIRVQETLLGQGGVQMLDGEAHRHRKEMFLSLMSPERVADLVRLTTDQLVWYALKWSAIERVTLYPELQEILARAVCNWAGVPLAEEEVRTRTRQLSALFDDAGSVGPEHWRSRQARNASERWIADLVDAIRAGEYQPPEYTAAHRVAFHRELNGELLPTHVAAVELLNVLRPTVAVSVYLVFVAHALHRFPECRERLLPGDPGYARAFVHEVRRFYPFFPATPARTRDAFEWHGYEFPANTRVMLDLHGVNHDHEVWTAPDEFRPERFGSWDGDAFNFIPQGSGDHRLDHRCPGEWITIELMLAATDFLTRRLSYVVPPQDLTIDESRLPALPRSRFVIEGAWLVD